MKEIIYSCDQCLKKISTNPNAPEYKGCFGATVIMKITIKGFCDEGVSVGVFDDTSELLLCKSCLKNTLGDIHFKGIKNQIENAQR